MGQNSQIQRIQLICYYWRKRQEIKKDKNQKRILYFGYPMHPNLGDQGQKYCIRKWLEENYPDYSVVEIPTKLIIEDKYRYIPIFKKYVRPDDIFIFQSGYCTHDLGNQIENRMHKRVISMFPNNRMLMLPQTVYFQNEKNKEDAAQVYGQAKRMLFLARDFVSYDIAKEMFPTFTVKAYPDIVTSLIGTRAVNTERKGVLFCLRKDIEKFYSDEELEVLIDRVSKLSDVERSDTTIAAEPLWLDKHIGERIDEEIKRYSKYKLIITDRYHGTIFSLVSGTPVIVIKTKDHKVSTGVDWFKGIYDEYVYYADTLDIAADKAKEVLGRSYSYKLEPYFKEKYYDRLRNYFDETVK